MGLIDPMTEVWNHSRSAGTERVVLLAISRHADPDGYAWPGFQRLQKMANVGDRATHAALAKLIEAGELAVLRGRGRGHASLYRVLLGQPADAGEREVMLAWLRAKTTPYLADLYEKVNESAPSENAGKVKLTAPSRPEKVQSRALEKVQSRAGNEPAYRKELPVTEEGPPTAAPPGDKRTDALLRQYIDSLPGRPPKREVGHLARVVKQMLDEGIASGLIWQTLDQDYRHRDVGPAYLPNLVAARQRGATRNGNGNGRRPDRAEIDARVERTRRENELGAPGPRASDEEKAAYYARFEQEVPA